MSATAISLNTGLAVVGMSCRVSDATSLDDFWSKLLAGHDSCSEAPKDVFDPDVYSSPSNKNGNFTRVRIGNWLNHTRWDFDAPFFGLSDEEALALDPEQRLALIVTQEALDMAGYSAPMSQCNSAKLATDPSRVGVFFASTCDDYRENLLPEHVDQRFYASVQRQFLAERVQRHWSFEGPAAVVDTVCNSSLVALDVAASSIRQGECDAAVVGGVNVITQPMPTIGLSTDHFLSETGTCKTFDACADGYSRGEAIGVVVLKRLTDALRDGDNVLSVVLSSGTNHSGESISLTFPHMPAQLALMRSNLDVTGIAPHTVTLAEAHGTGTQAGDPCELEAISTAFVGDADPRRVTLVVTTNKANFGHSEASSGICSLIKAIVEIRTGVVPPHIGVRTKLNPELEHLARDPLQICFKEAGKVPMLREQDFVTACVNNFGAAGGNTSLLLRGPSSLEVAVNNHHDADFHLVFLSARTREAADKARQDLCKAMGEQSLAAALGPLTLGDISYTSVARRPHYAVRAAIIAKSLDEARQKLADDSIPYSTVSGGTSSAVLLLSRVDGETSSKWDHALRNTATYQAAYRRAHLAFFAKGKARTHQAILYGVCAMLLNWGTHVELDHVFAEESGVRVGSSAELDSISGLRHAPQQVDHQVTEADVRFELKNQDALRLQLLLFLKKAFENGIVLNWQAVQADLNPAAHVCVLPSYPFEMQRHAVVYRDLGIVESVWGENPVRVMRVGEGQEQPMTCLGLVAARKISADEARTVFELQSETFHDVLSVFTFAALAAVRRAKPSMHGLYILSLASMAIEKEDIPSLLEVNQQNSSVYLVTLKAQGATIAEANVYFNTHVSKDWDALAVFLDALRHDAAAQKITKLVVKRLVPWRSDVQDVLAGTVIAASGRSALLVDVPADLALTLAQSVSELLQNHDKLSPDTKRTQAVVQGMSFLTDELGANSDRYDIFACRGAKGEARVLLCSRNDIVGEITLVFADPVKGPTKADKVRDSVQQPGANDTIAGQPQESEGSAALAAAAKIIEAEVGVDVTLPNNATTSFASLGVDSLMSLLLLDRMREVVSIELPRSLFFDYDDWTSLATFLAGGGEGAEKCEEDTVVVGAALQSAPEHSAPLDTSSEDHQSAILPSATGTFAEHASTSASSIQQLPRQMSIKSVSDVEAAVSLVEKILGPGKTMRERNATPSKITHLQSHFISPLPNAVFRPDNTDDDIRSILVGPVHAASMVRRSSILGTKGQSSNNDQPIFLIPDGSGSAAVFNTIPQTKRTVYALNSPYLGDKAPGWKDGVVEIAAAYIYQMRERQPCGPYLFGGWSFGGIVSLEVARQLLADGEKVIGILLLDAPCPQYLPPLPCEILEWGQKGSHGQQVQQFPPALLRHFRHAIDSLHTYEPPPLLQDEIDRGIDNPSIDNLPPAALFTAADGVPIDPKLVPNSNITVEWLFGERHNLGPQGWDRLFGQGRVEVADIPGTHFSMMEPHHAGVWWARVEETVDRWLRRGGCT